jgi:hypothetical protein
VWQGYINAARLEMAREPIVWWSLAAASSPEASALNTVNPHFRLRLPRPLAEHGMGEPGEWVAEVHKNGHVAAVLIIRGVHEMPEGTTLLGASEMKVLASS